MGDSGQVDQSPCGCMTLQALPPRIPELWRWEHLGLPGLANGPALAADALCAGEVFQRALGAASLFMEPVEQASLGEERGTKSNLPNY